jgi:Uma2 family endonuclease
MPSTTLISVDEYLRTSYSPDFSPEDRMGRVRERVNDYLAFGVQHVWVLDPASREGFVADVSGFHAPSDQVLSIPGTPVHLPLPQIFAELD